MYLNKQNFLAEILKLMPKYKKENFLLAVSGGADSMVLANLFLVLNLKFQIAHINYKLRGEDSKLDENVVRDFCEKNDIKFHLYTVSEADKKPENSIQLWARNLRYDFFEKIKNKENIGFIVTAHHLNDELETFIINLSRASGLKGLSGIPKNKNQIFRPLLKFSKEEIYRFAQENNIKFREDKSNKKTDYLRNFIRNDIAPALKKTNKNFLENFSKSLTFLGDAEGFIASEIENKRENLSIQKHSKIIFDKEKLDFETDFVKFQILKTYGFKDVKEVLKIFTAKNGSLFFSKTHSLKVSAKELIIENLHKTVTENMEIVINKTSEIYMLKYVVNYTEQDKIWTIDAGKIAWPIIARKALPDDVFQPIGMRGKKKISKFIKELKISEVDFQPLVLADSSGAILGVFPHRQSEKLNGKNASEILTIFL